MLDLVETVHGAETERILLSTPPSPGLSATEYLHKYMYRAQRLSKIVVDNNTDIMYGETFYSRHFRFDKWLCFCIYVCAAILIKVWKHDKHNVSMCCNLWIKYEEMSKSYLMWVLKHSQDLDSWTYNWNCKTVFKSQVLDWLK
jgi:hypothetical protein